MGQLCSQTETIIRGYEPSLFSPEDPNKRQIIISQEHQKLNSTIHLDSPANQSLTLGYIETLKVGYAYTDMSKRLIQSNSRIEETPLRQPAGFNKSQLQSLSLQKSFSMSSPQDKSLQNTEASLTKIFSRQFITPQTQQMKDMSRSKVLVPSSQDTYLTVTSQLLPTSQTLNYSFYESLKLKGAQIDDNINLPDRDRTVFVNEQRYGIKYKGYKLGDLPHGFGIMITAVSQYQGLFKYGLKHYKGRQIYSDEVYNGQFQNGIRKGQGIRYAKQRYQEKGQFNKILIEGFIQYPSGDSYEGPLSEDGLFEGKGIYKHSATNTIYKCNFVGGAIHGFADYVAYGDGSFYIGPLYKGLRHTSFIGLAAEKPLQENELIKRAQNDTNFQKLLLINSAKQMLVTRPMSQGLFIWPNKTMYRGGYFMDVKHGQGYFIDKTYKHDSNKKLQQQGRMVRFTYGELVIPDQPEQTGPAFPKFGSSFMEMKIDDFPSEWHSILGHNQSLSEPSIVRY